MSTYQFPNCCCSFPIVGETPDGRPAIEFNPVLENLNLECSRTWDLISAGNTIGCFQLEDKQQALARKLKPRNIEHLAALIAILRPGVLNSIRNKKSVTMHYIDRKNGEEEVTYFHPALEPILKSTYGEMCYQEQCLQIAKDIAGFNLVEANALRKSIGKKLPEEMAKLKNKFLDGCKKQNIVNEDEAKQIFEWIEKSQKYGFNKSLTGDVNCSILLQNKKIDVTLLELIKLFNNNKLVKILSPVYDKYGRIKTSEYVRLLNVYNHGLQQVYIIYLKSGKNITCTPYHKFMCKGLIEVPLWKILLDGLLIKTIDGYDEIIKWENNGYKSTYDIEVDNNHHTYYANNIITSNSHAVSYAMNTYLSAYVKAHFPKAFFTSYLRYTKDKMKPFEEIHTLVQNARLMNISVNVPDFRKLTKHFILRDKNIYFGFVDIKGIGEAVYNKIVLKIEEVSKLLGRPIDKWSWIDFLVSFTPHITTTAIEAIINSGSLSYMNMSRTRMIYEYNIFAKFTKTELQWVANHVLTSNGTVSSLEQILRTILVLPCNRTSCCKSQKRHDICRSLLKVLVEPSYDLTDTPAWLASIESNLFGIPLTCTSLESCKTEEANCTCMEYLEDKAPKIIILAATIDDIREVKTKTGKSIGQKMAFLKISDITGSVDSVIVFPDKWKEFRKIAFLGNNVLINGEKSKDKGALFVKNMWQI
jgi:DNA polymerase III alpha subunit